MGSIQHIDLSERHGHRDDHGFANGAEFNVKIRRRVEVPDFVRAKLSEREIDELWWEEAERAKQELEDELRRRYRWVGRLVFVGRGPGWLAVEDTVGGRPRNWDAIGDIVSERLREFVASMEDADTWRDVRGIEGPGVRSELERTMSMMRTRSGDKDLKLKDRQSGNDVHLTVRGGIVVSAMGSDPKRFLGLTVKRARRVARYGGSGGPEVGEAQLAWSSGQHRGSSDVFYTAEDPSPGLKHGKYQIRRAEGGNALMYERWRDEHGGAVPIQHVRIGDRYRSLSAAKAAAEAHHEAVLDRAREISTGLTEGHLGSLQRKREALEASLGRGRPPATSKIEQDVARVSGVVRGGRSKRR